MPTVTARPVRAVIAVLSTLTLAMAACDDGGDADTLVVSAATADAAPGRCADIARHFGHTLQGTSSLTFLEVVHVLYVLDDQFGLAGCEFNIAESVDQACTSPACIDGSFERCLVVVEQAMREYGCTTQACGDGICQDHESVLYLDEDTGVTSVACPEDCTCGNGICEPERNETQHTCEHDCPAICGDGRCSWTEQCGDPLAERPWMTRCDEDCCGLAQYRSICGDGVCSTSSAFGGPALETGESCEEDCGAGRCGDGRCLPPETPDNCRDDCQYSSCGVAPDLQYDSCAGGGNCLTCPAGCADPYERCGDGVCSGCEVWTCAMDCMDADFGLCTRSEDGQSMVCPPTYCGDGTCAGGVENARTCPQDCEAVIVASDSGQCGDGTCDAVDRYKRCVADCDGAPTVCGDGYCEPGEAGTAIADPDAWTVCEADCDGGPASCPADPNHPECLQRGSRCLRVPVTGTFTGESKEQWAAFDCASCALTMCPDECTTEGGQARCIECSRDPQLERCGDRAERAVCLSGDWMQSCIPDPGAPSERGCDLLDQFFCPNGCANGQCQPCTGAESCPDADRACDPATGRCLPVCGDGLCSRHEVCPQDCDPPSSCGDGWCWGFESAESCAQDCTCTAECPSNAVLLDPDAELWCPQRLATCHCGNSSCDSWEQEGGPWPCPADCP